MELENRLRGDAAGAGSARLIERIETNAPREELFSGREASGRDPYGELKTRVQRAVIAKLGPRLFGSAHATGDLRRQVTDAVVAELATEETPLAQTDRERLTRELTADILGYGPIEPFLAEVARGVADEASPPPELVWATNEFLTSHGVAPWAGPASLPMWLPEQENRGFMARDARPAVRAGLELRSVAETARDTLAWVRADPAAPVTGLSRSTERELVAAWRRDG